MKGWHIVRIWNLTSNVKSEHPLTFCQYPIHLVIFWFVFQHFLPSVHVLLLLYYLDIFVGEGRIGLWVSQDHRFNNCTKRDIQYKSLKYICLAKIQQSSNDDEALGQYPVSDQPPKQAILLYLITKPIKPATYKSKRSLCQRN